MFDGVVNVYKEAGYTSHDVVAKLRGILGQKKIGHTGTLDPEATGVLPVCLGKGTKLCELLTDKEKTYETVMRLGIEMDTQDMTGTILSEQKVNCTEGQVRKAVESFLGAGMQVPPMYSALKVNGKKLYELAREGKVVERIPRPVHFYELEILRIELPRVWLRVTCSKGTYIRTLCHDIGRKLGCNAAMEKLTRIRVGRFSLEESHSLEEIRQYVLQDRLEEILYPVDTLLADYPALFCPKELDGLLHNGNPLEIRAVSCGSAEGWIRMYDSEHVFVGIYEKKPGTARYFPVKMFYQN